MISLEQLYEQLHDRSQMPQIAAEDMVDAFTMLSKAGVPVCKSAHLPSSLKPSQKQLHKAKVSSILADLNQQKSMAPPVVSQDGFIVDGHHRWAAYLVKAPHTPITTVEIGYPKNEAIALYKKVSQHV